MANCGACGNVCPAAAANQTAACAAGSCSLVCNAGFVNCDGQAANGCESDPQTDPNNCGSCGVVCPAPKSGPAVCAAGQCAFQPLVSGLNAPAAIAIDATHLYWAEQGSFDAAFNYSHDGAVKRVPLAGGAVEVLASGLEDPYAIALDAGNVYWAEYGSFAPFVGAAVKKKAKAGGAVTTLATQSGYGVGPQMAVDSSRVYWANTWDGQVDSVPVGGGSTTALVITTGWPWSVAVDSTSLYWTENFAGQTVYRADLNGANQVTVGVADSYAAGIVVFGSTVAWGDTPDSNGNGLKVWSASAAGNGARTLLNPNYPVSANLLAADGTRVYASSYSDNPGSPQSELQSGGGEKSYPPGGYFGVGIAVDSTYVYWATEGDHFTPHDTTAAPIPGKGAIFKAPK
jgi:hypothetical protein